MIQYLIYFTLIINCLWFLGGFKAFALSTQKTCESMRPDLDSTDPIFKIIVPALKFLGGRNLGFLILNLSILVISYSSYNKDLILVVLFASAVAHGSQFTFNLPQLKGMKNGAAWDVNIMPMKFIFIVDFLTMFLNFAVFIAASL
jgi:hypothetical protein